jgi:hypothetical protein
MQLVAGNSLIGARRQAFGSYLLTPKKGEKSWLDEVPKRYALYRDEGGKMKDQRPEHSVYHFLLPDSGMAHYNDKVVKQMTAHQLDVIKKWRAQFCRSFETHRVAPLERLSANIDRLWQEHTRDRCKLRDETRDAWDLFGYAVQGTARALTTQEKDRLFNQRILSRIDANSSAYRRLKLVMDYWCALWFWPIDKAQMLPTREEFLLELQSIIEGGVVEVTPVEDNQFLLNLGGVPVQPELDLYEKQGYVNLNKLCRDYPRLALVQRLAERYRFHHWELELADLFAGRGGFDLVLGNPPWIKIEWSEGGVLGDVNPRFVFDNLSASQLNQLREETLKMYPDLRAEYLAEFEEAEATQSFLNGYQNYPMLRGIQTNLYKCFLPQSWHIGSPAGMSGFLHPEGVYDDPKGGRFRQEIYSRLRYHLQFQNERKDYLFQDVHNETVFSVNIYQATKVSEIKFDNVANLFGPETLYSSYEHSGQGEVRGIKDDNNNWNLKGHRERIVKIDEHILALFGILYDEPGTPPLYARLPVVHASEIVPVLEKFARYPRRLGDLKGEYFPTEMWHETNTQKDGTIRRDTHIPKDAGQWILSGPHFYVGKPFHQTPRRVCITNRSYDNLDLQLLPNDYLPRTNYVPACAPSPYRNRTPKVPWDNRPVTEFYRIFFRRQLSQSGERTLTPAIVPPNVGHIHPVNSLTAGRDVLLDFAPLCLSIVFDFFIKTTGKGDLYESTLRLLPVARETPQRKQLTFALSS